MLDIKVLRNDPEKLERAMLKRKEKFDTTALFEMDDERKIDERRICSSIQDFNIWFLICL